MAFFRALVGAFKKYFENTSIHGFRYIAESTHWVYRLFWVANLVVAFTLLGHLLKQTLDEAEANPTVTNLEEVPIDNVPAPAFSVLAPKLLHAEVLERRILNGLDACDAELAAGLIGSKAVKAFAPAVAKFNAFVRRQIETDVSSGFDVAALEEQGKVK